MRRLVKSFLVLGALAAGCGSETKPPPVDVYPVTGSVNYKGQPVVGADITFFNTEADRSSFGRTDDRGEYRLTTFSMNDGAVAGKHIVTITKVEAAPVTAPLPDVESIDYAPPGIGEETVVAPPPKASIPAKYGDQQTSGLVAVVNSDAPNKFDFDLTD
jgi:hypothetical protein